MGRDKKDDKEIPTITSLLKRKKLRAGGDSLDRSKPMDLSELEKEFAPVQESEHPVIEGIDNWDTRGIARQVKHNEAAKKSDEFKALLERKAREEITGRNARKAARERSISISVKIDKQQQKPVVVKTPEPAPVRPAKTEAPGVKPVAPRAPKAPVVPITPSTRAVRAPAAPTAPTASAPVPAQPATTRGVSNARPLATWTMEMLKGGPDPLGKGLSILLERGATMSLFLSISPPPPGAKIPHFVAAAAARPTRDKAAIWAGLRWDPATVPQVWNQLLKSGYVEFHPPGNVTHIGSNRNTIRAAFGLGNEQILLLIRVGPVAACRGVLAILSDRSLLMELGPILTLFNTPLPLQKTG